MPKDDLDRINHVIDTAGWDDHYLVELLLAFVSARKLRPELLGYLKQAAADEKAAGVRKVL